MWDQQRHNFIILKMRALRFTANESCNKPKCAILGHFEAFHSVEIVKNPKKIVLFYYARNDEESGYQP